MIYLDYNATSPLHPEVRREIAPFLEEGFGNASSVHSKGRQARAAVESVRAELLEALGDPSGQLIFTSGGTEADNLALKGIAWALRDRGNHLVVSTIEHHAVLHAAEALEEEGIRVTRVPVDGQARVNLNALEEAIGPKTVLISVMHANNEVGTIQPILEIGQIAKRHGVLFHTDAVQSFGRLPLNVLREGVDLASVSAHKLGGMKGAGALYHRQGIKLRPLLHGGPHERNLRGGTEAVPAIVGMGAALRVSLKQQGDGTLSRVRGLRDQLEAGLRRIPGVEILGHPAERLPGTLNASFFDCRAESLLIALDLAGICVSSGSACSSGSTEPSHVLTAMGLAGDRVRGSIRFSLGWGTTEREIVECLGRLAPIVEQVRKNGVLRENAR
ncbi:MAG: cysteine desulfurase [Candidatus Omnitrophica bacterium]|nr:cysteine desulfurase [Candidatus Omnitrophota bacterium]